MTWIPPNSFSGRLELTMREYLVTKGLQLAQRLVYRAFFRRRDRRVLAMARLLNEGSGGRRPLVTIAIPTYDRPEVLLQRAVRSALAQTYGNIEVLVVGDACPPDVARRIREGITDPRVRFHNLDRRGEYPRTRYLRWLVAGAAPRNASHKLAKGDWLAPLDDDDELAPDHIERLLQFAHSSGAELVWAKARARLAGAEWETWGSGAPDKPQIVHSAMLVHRSLSFVPYRLGSWLWGEPTDRDRWWRLHEMGARMAFLDAVVATHYAERTQVHGGAPA